MLKVGTFQCRVLSPVNGWFGEAGINNTPFIRIPLVVTEQGESQGEKVEYAAWISHKSLDRTMKNLAEVFGFDGNLERLAELLDDGPFVGQDCSITTAEEEYNGKVSVKIKWLNKSGGGGRSMDRAAAIALAKKFNADAMKFAAAQRAEDAASQAQPAKSRVYTPKVDTNGLDVSGSDIPF